MLLEKLIDLIFLLLLLQGLTLGILLWSFLKIHFLTKKINTMKDTLIFIAKVAVGTVVGLKIAAMLTKKST